MKQRSFLPPAPRHHVAARFVTIAVVLGGIACALLFAALSWVRAAVLTIAVVLVVVAILRAITPGRPWFSSRNRVADVLFLLTIAAAIVYFSPWVSVAGS